MYRDFYEIPLPALRFEKVEETDKSEKRHRRERRLPNRPHQRNKENDAKIDSTETQIHSQVMTRKEHKRFQNDETQTEKERQ